MKKDSKINIYDISKLAGVSTATVSRVLNGSTNVKPRTRKKVMDIIEQYGYKPNAFARGLGLNSMKTIGILCADASEDNQYIKDAAVTVPIMLLNADFDCNNVYCTLCDDYKATQDATEQLINGGAKDILYLYNSNSYSGLKKLAGFQNALLTHDIPLKKQLMQCFKGSHEDIDGVKGFVESLHAKGLKFDAIVTSDDFLAVGSMNFARANHIKVPSELQVIGYNNSILSHCSEPELSSIDNRLEDMCIQLVKTLVGTLTQNEMPQKTIFSGELVKRGSTRI